jgi:hypothetical protein
MDLNQDAGGKQETANSPLSWGRLAASTLGEWGLWSMMYASQAAAHCQIQFSS